MSMDGNFGGNPQKVLTVLPCIVRHAANDTFLINQIVGKGGDGAHMNAAEHQDTSLSQCRERGGNDFSRGSKNDGGIELCGRLGKGSSRPFGAELECEFLMARITGGGVYIHVPVPRHLNGDVSGRAESVKAQFAARLDSRKAQAAE